MHRLHTFRLATITAAVVTLAAAPAPGASVFDDFRGYVTDGIDVNTTEAEDFDSAVQAAWDADRGASLRFRSLISGTDFDTTAFGAGDSVRLAFTTNESMQSAGDNGSFGPLTSEESGKVHAFLQSSDSNGWALTFGDVTDADTGDVLNLGVAQVGMTLLPRNDSTYPLDAVVTASFSDSTDESITVNLGDTKNDTDTFVGFTAPTGEAITGFTIDTFATGTSDAVSTRVALDQLGFVLVPEPSSVALIGFGAMLLAVRRRR